MEVASPLAVYDNKRSLTGLNGVADDVVVGHLPNKRRRFHETSVDSLANDFSQPWNTRMFAAAGTPAGTSFKRLRDTSSDLQKTIEEQKLAIETLTNDKTVLEQSLHELHIVHEKTIKENQILRKAVTIQQDKRNQHENQLKDLHKVYGSQIKNLETTIVSLKYHLSAQQSAQPDFSQYRPPDVY